MKSHWTELLSKAVAQSADKVPREYITLRGFAREIGRSASRAHKLMSQNIALGLVEKKVFKIVVNGVIRSIPHYRIKT